MEIFEETDPHPTDKCLRLQGIAQDVKALRTGLLVFLKQQDIGEGVGLSGSVDQSRIQDLGMLLSRMVSRETIQPTTSLLTKHFPIKNKEINLLLGSILLLSLQTLSICHLLLKKYVLIG